MESKDNIFNNNSRDNKISFNNDLKNLKYISDKKIKINNIQQEFFDFYNTPEKEKDISIKKKFNNNQEIVGFFTQTFNNKKTFMNHKPQKYLPKTKETIDNLMQEKEELFEEKVKEDLSSVDDGEEENDINNIVDLKPKEEIKNISIENLKEINKKTVHFKSEENKEENNYYKKDNENNKKSTYLNSSFSYDIEDIDINTNLNKNYILSFFYPTTKYLKEELDHDFSYYSYFYNSHNYLPKFALEFICNENYYNSSKHINNINKNDESIRNESLNFNISPNIISGIYKQINDITNNKKNISNKENENYINENNLNNYDNILNNSKCENKLDIKEQSQKEIIPIIEKNELRKSLTLLENLKNMKNKNENEKLYNFTLCLENAICLLKEKEELIKNMKEYNENMRLKTISSVRENNVKPTDFNNSLKNNERRNSFNSLQPNNNIK